LPSTHSKLVNRSLLFLYSTYAFSAPESTLRFDVLDRLLSVRSLLFSYVQVREARPYHIFGKICLFDEYMMIERPMCEYNRLKMPVGLCGYVWVTVTRKNNGGHWFSRPSEHASPRRGWQRLAQVSCTNGRPGDLASFLSEVQSRLGEKGLAWARPRRGHCSLVAPSPRRDGTRLSERIPLAWASPACLSEAAGKFGCYCGVAHWCVTCLSDPNALLEGSRDDGMIYIGVWDGNGMLFCWVWIGKHELYDGLCIHDVSIWENFLIGWRNMN